MPLNPSQQRAVDKIEGPCLIIAGAGTGKTQIIVEKLAHFVKQGADPKRILALTFSNEAAKSMKERAEEKCAEARDMHISTFHSFCAEFIREHPSQCGIKHTFDIIDELDIAILLKRELKLDVYDAKHYANTICKAKDLSISMADYRGYIEAQENLLTNFYAKPHWQEEYDKALVKLRTMHLDITDSKEDRKSQKEEKTELKEFIDLYDNYIEYKRFVEAWERYEQFKRSANILDFSDLNIIVIDFVKRYGSDELADAFDYIVVDEFQDTNKVQFELLVHLTAKKKNITVVGDQNQTIYAFRGAYADNISKFRKVFKLNDSDIIKIKENYRSTNKILKTAHNLIKNNYDDQDECVLLKSAFDREGGNVKIIQAKDRKEQARRIIEEIEKIAGADIGYKDIAVLYRSHSSAGEIKRALQQRGIPFATSGGAEFFSRPEVKSAISYLYVLNNFSNPILQTDQAWWHLLHNRFGLSAADSTRLGEYKKAKKISFQRMIYDHLSETGLTPRGKETIELLKKTIDYLRTKITLGVADLVLKIYDASGLARQYSHERTPENTEALMNLRDLHARAQAFETFHGTDLIDFIDYLEMIDEMGGGFPSSQVLEENSVKLMTVHAAKGLEFESVFLMDMIKDKFPLTRGGVEPLIPKELDEQFAEIFSNNGIEDKEKAIKEFVREIKKREERRLCYVAMTRAKNALTLTLAQDYGGKEEREPSEFLYEIGAQPPWFSQDKATGDDLVFENDAEIKAKLAADTDMDRALAERKRLMLNALDSKDPDNTKYHVLVYEGLLKRKPQKDASALGKKSAAEVKEILKNIKDNNQRGLRFNPSALRFSVTSMGVYMDCPKKYEMKEILGMPSRDDEDDSSGALNFGSWVHHILEEAVKRKIKTKEELMELMKEYLKEGIDEDRSCRIMEIFWIRNRNDIQKASITEQDFKFMLDGFAFSGRIDRIDDLGNNRVRIVDYKTGGEPTKDKRELQLLLYAIAVQSDPALMKRKWIPSELVLEMLEQEKPLIFTLENGEMKAPGTRIKCSNIEDIKQKALEIAKDIAHDYEHGFAVPDTNNNCKRCSYRLYCPKW